MAINAKFTADFKSFYDAVDKAEVELRGLETGAAKVEKSLNRMADSFSGRKLIQDANLTAKAIEEIGGASTLTAKEAAKVNAQVTEALAKYKALGMEAPPALQKLARETAGVGVETTKASSGITSMMGSLVKMAGALGIAFSAGAVISFGKQVFATAGQIDDLSKKMGVSAETVQKWKFAAEQSGATIEHVDKAVLAMAKSLASTDKGEIASYTAALKRIGLSFEELRTMRPDQAFEAIAKAIEGVENPMERAKVTTQLFLKAGAELIPALVEGFVRVGDGADAMANETVKRLADAEDAWEKFTNKATIYTGEFLGAVLEQSENWFATIDRMTSSLGKFAQTAQIIAAGSLGGLTGLQEAMKIVGALEKAEQGTGKKPEQTQADRKASIEAAIAQARATAEAEGASRKAEKATDDYADALKRLREIIPPLTAAQRKSVDAWLDQGKATKDMAIVLRVNEKAVIDYKKQQEDLDKILEKGIGSVLGLGDGFKQMGEQIKLTDGIVSSSMVLLEDYFKGLKDLHLFGIGAPQIQIPVPEPPPPGLASAWERHFLGLSDASAEAARVNGEVWAMSFYTITGHLDQLAAEFDNFFGDILSAAADVSNALSVIFNPNASTLDKVMAGLDLAIELGKKFVGLFKDEAHEKTNDLRDDFLAQFGGGDFVGFNNLAAQLAKIEGGTPAFKSLMDAKTPEAFAVAMERVNKLLANTPGALAAASGFQTKAQLQELAAEAVKIHAYMRDSGLYTAGAVQEAWERANAALVKAGDESAIAAGKAEDALAGLKAELKSLEDSVANEAPEEVMGVIETQQRARIDNIKEELKAREAQIEEEKKAREAANEDAADHLQQILAEQVFIAKLQFDYELPEGLTVTGGSGVPGFASGTRGQYLDFGAGTLAMLHGKERVVTEAEGRAGSVGGDDGYAPIHVQVGEETLIKAIVKVRKRLRLHV